MKMKRKSGATTGKKATTKRKPAAKKAAAPKKAVKATSPAAAPAPPRKGVYTPPAVQGMGWGPFRYPLA